MNQNHASKIGLFFSLTLNHWHRIIFWNKNLKITACLVLTLNPENKLYFIVGGVGGGGGLAKVEPWPSLPVLPGALIFLASYSRESGSGLFFLRVYRGLEGGGCPFIELDNFPVHSRIYPHPTDKVKTPHSFALAEFVKKKMASKAS